MLPESNSQNRSDRERSSELEGFFEANVEDLQNVDVEREARATEASQPVDNRFPEQVALKDVEKGFTSPAFLTGLASWHPAIASFQYLADCMSPKTMSHDQRFNRAIQRHKWLYYICIVIDMIVILAVLAAIGAVAYQVIKTTLFE